MRLTQSELGAVGVAASLHATACAQLPPNGETIQRRTSAGIAPPPIGFSHVAPASGKIIYVSGQVARTADGDLVGPGDFEAQLRQVFENLNTASREAGGSFDHVVRMNIFCVSTVPETDLPRVLELRDAHASAGSRPDVFITYIPGLVRPEWPVEIDAVISVPEAMS